MSERRNLLLLLPAFGQAAIAVHAAILFGNRCAVFLLRLGFRTVFTRAIGNVNRLYAFDLLGAGLGCVGVAVAMPTFGGSGSVIIAAMLGPFAVLRQHFLLL